ncbi:MAG: glycosyltransferase family 4 protein [Betaproteobacteria bacterium]|nr:glycosyltransferase family 4 protein [Betaproteobacteria bacterium]
MRETIARETIAHLLPEYNPFPPVFPAGTELRVEQVARRQRRYRPVVICRAFPGQADTEVIEAMTVRRVRIGRLYRRLFQKITRLDPLPYTDRMWRVARAEGAALLHVHNEPKLLAGVHRHLLRTRMPTVVHVANEKPLPRVSLDVVTHWVACSRYIRDWIARDHGIAPARISVIYTGVDAAGCRPAWEIPADQRSALRRRFGIEDPKDTVLLFAGRLVREKGVNELLDAFALLRERFGERLRLLVAGNVRDSDDPRNEKAVYGRAASARMAGMRGVRWVGSLHPSEVHEFLLAGDVFVMPSLWHDPFPTIMLEAAAAGLPIVAGARGGITEFLAGCPGFAFVGDPAEVRQLADSIAAFVADPQRRVVSGRWLRAKVEREFDWSRVCGEFEDLYDRLLHPDKALRA